MYIPKKMIEILTYRQPLRIAMGSPQECDGGHGPGRDSQHHQQARLDAEAWRSSLGWWETLEILGVLANIPSGYVKIAIENDHL